MNNSIRLTRKSLLVIVLALLAALLLSTPVFAEEEAPVIEPATAQESAPAVETPAQAPAPAEQPVDPLPGDEPASDEQPVVEEPQPEQPEVEQPATEMPVTEPSDTDETPGNSSSEDGMLETNEQNISAQYSGGVNSGDVYYYNAAKVAQISTSIQGAIDAYQTAGSGAVGMIYVTSGSYIEDVILSQNLTGLNPTGLVFLDYYPTEAAKYDADAFDAYDSGTWVQLNGSITITNLPNFTLLGFKISSGNGNATVFIDNTDSGSGTLTLSYLEVDNTSTGNGINVQNHTGTVNVSGVKTHSSSTTRSGMYIGGDSGRGTRGAVSIINSSSNNNAYTGLTIFCTGLATLNGVTAVGNDRHGALINSAGALVKNSVFSSNGDDTTESGFFYSQNGKGNLTVENSQFNKNYSIGLTAIVYGNISLKNIRADNNGNVGVNLDTCDDNDTTNCRNTSSGNISITDSNIEENGYRSVGYGLRINSAKGSVILTNVWVNGNGDGDMPTWGAYITNQYSPTKSPVTITNNSFDNNKNNGLWVKSLGLITLKDSSASGNTGGSYGAYLDNSETGATAGVNIQNSTGRTNNFNDNAASSAGLVVYSNGAIQANSIYANNTSGARGVELNNLESTASAGITVKLGGFDNNTDGGLYVFSKGVITVTMTDCSASDNSGSGARGIYLDNDAASSAKAVTLDGGSYHNNDNFGIQIVSLGAILVRNVEVNGSTNSSGMRLDNNLGSNASVTVTATRTNWTNTFNGNNGYGLYITSKGTILVNRTNAEDNNNHGANIYNKYTSVTGGVTVTSSNFRKNSLTTVGGSGLQIQSYGAVTLNGVVANNNGDSGKAANGAYINNRTESGSGIGKPVTITNSQFNDNYDEGLGVESCGTIKITGLYTTNNADSGANLFNRHSGSTTTSVTISNAWFNGNGGSRGLYLESYGNVTLKNVEAKNNAAGDGIFIAMLQGTPPTTTGNVSYTCASTRCSISGNSGEGLHVENRGTITLSNINSTGNSVGAYLINNTASDSATKAITISNCDFSNNEGMYGLYAYSKGAISLTNVDAAENATYGAELNNTFHPTAAPVTIKGSGDWDWFGGNGSFGLAVYSKGKVTITKVNASDNQTYGLKVDNSGSTTSQPVSISFAEASRNWHTTGSERYGLNVNSMGMITLSNVWAVENGDGESSTKIGVSTNARLNNNSSLTNAAVTLTNVYFNNAFGYDVYAGDGLYISSKGMVTITNIQANNNTGDGVEINNQNSTTMPGVTMKRSGTFINTMDQNGLFGVDIYSYGTISVAYLYSRTNGDVNLYIDNTGNGDVAKAVTITNSVFDNSGTSGVMIYACGAVTLVNVDANANVTSGIYIQNTSYGSYNLSVTNVKTNGNQNGDGLRFVSTGAVTARGLTALNNKQNGMHFGTNGGAEIGNFTLSGTNLFNGNSLNGLRIESAGNVSLTQVTAEKNGQSGVAAAAYAGTGTLTLNKVYANYNGGFGVAGSSNNTILLNTVYTLNNGTTADSDGIYMIQGSTTASTSLLNCVTQGNTGSGIEIDIDIAGGALRPIITNTTYFGNDVDSSGAPEVFIH